MNGQVDGVSANVNISVNVMNALVADCKCACTDVYVKLVGDETVLLPSRV